MWLAPDILAHRVSLSSKVGVVMKSDVCLEVAESGLGVKNV